MEIHTRWESKEGETCQLWLYYTLNEYTHSLRIERGGKHVSCDGTYETEIRTAWESKVAWTYQPWWCCTWDGNTHILIIKSGRNKSALMVLRMKWEYALPGNRECRDQVSLDCADHEMEIRTRWESKVAGTCQSWLWRSWNGNTHQLKVKNGRNMSVVMIQLVEWKYTLPMSRKWREHVSHDCATNEKENTHCLPQWESNVARTCKLWRCLLMKMNYALPENQKRREHVSRDGVAHEMEIHTRLKWKVAGTCQQRCSSWNRNAHFLIIESDGNMSAMMLSPMKWKYALPDNRKLRGKVSFDSDCAAHEMEYTPAESKSGGTSQPWWCHE